MAERLTRNNKVNFYFHDEASNMVYYKLQGLEDILEKYGIESVEELDDLLQDGCDAICILKENSKLETDRDTWKRACELACDVLRDINYKIYNEDRIDFENTFYQQAKKEKENEDDDTDN